MMTPDEARQVPMLDIKPPLPEEFELRVIVWKTEDIPMKTKVRVSLTLTLITLTLTLT